MRDPLECGFEDAWLNHLRDALRLRRRSGGSG